MSDDHSFTSAEFGDAPPRSRRRISQPAAAPEAGAAERWWTLREAADATGVPVATLRRWYRRGRISGRLTETPAGSRVHVRAGDVLARAGQSQPGETRDRARTGAPAPRSTTPEPAQAPHPSGPAPPPGPLSSSPEPAPSDGVLVPRDTWQRILSQLGNLHEAGQQLAEARERAARAETEATFLRERLAELRAAASAHDLAADPATGTVLGTAPARQAAEAPEPSPLDRTGPNPPISDPPAGTRVTSTAAGRAVDEAVAAVRRAWASRRRRP